MGTLVETPGYGWHCVKYRSSVPVRPWILIQDEVEKSTLGKFYKTDCIFDFSIDENTGRMYNVIGCYDVYFELAADATWFSIKYC